MPPKTFVYEQTLYSVIAGGNSSSTCFGYLTSSFFIPFNFGYGTGFDFISDNPIPLGYNNMVTCDWHTALSSTLATLTLIHTYKHTYHHIGRNTLQSNQSMHSSAQSTHQSKSVTTRDTFHAPMSGREREDYHSETSSSVVWARPWMWWG